MLLERIHTCVWREQSFSKTVGDIRRERDAIWWETVKQVSTAKRKRENESLVHPRSGTQTNVHHLMPQVLGLH